MYKNLHKLCEWKIKNNLINIHDKEDTFYISILEIGFTYGENPMYIDDVIYTIHYNWSGRTSPKFRASLIVGEEEYKKFTRIEKLNSL